ncbi:MAG: glycosyltransferase [Ignavibacteria bacterium]|nr:glycosyltransferase [Ignavibacteria bacterium]
MNSNSRKKVICLIIPSLVSGGMERVMSEIANDFSERENLETHLVILTKQPIFYTIKEKVIVHEPGFRTKGVNKLLITIKLLRYLRKTLKEINPHSYLSFGGRYNSFAMLASIGLKMKKYLSDRNSPQISSRLSFKSNSVYKTGSWLQYIFKHILYPNATGLIVQTQTAKEIESERLRHPNIITIPNPIRKIESNTNKREKIILNVGRFAATKQQELLIEIFSQIDFKDWKLVFAGEGPLFQHAKEKVKELKLESNVEFAGTLTDIDSLYKKSEIFAFTSVSEGFPNALAEALCTPLATIAMDCIAGPRDMIENDYNGFLIPQNDIELYKTKLSELINNEELRNKFKANSIEKMKNFNFDKIMDDFCKVLIS